MPVNSPPFLIAALDAGSNAIRATVARANSATEIRELASARWPVRLGHGAFTRKQLDPRTMTRAVEAFLKFRNLLDRYDVQDYYAVATSAVREANNRDQLISRIRRETAIELCAIDTREEARLARVAVFAEGGLRFAPRAIADLGGGSLELLIAEVGQMPWSVSLPLGGSFLRERYAPADPPQRSELAALHYFLNTYLAHLPIPARPQQLIFAGGTVNALLRLIQRARNIEISQTSLTPDDLEDALLLLQASPVQYISRHTPVERL